MLALFAVLVGLALSAPAVAEPLVQGQVRLASGQPVAAQVMVFDLMDLQRGPVAQATTDAAGYFALPLASLGGPALPQGFALGQNYPNPFNPSTIIPYQLPTAAPVRLEVFNVLGQRVATLVDAERPAGFHTAVWDATNAAGQAVAAGVYLYRLTAEGVRHTRRMVLIDGQAGVAAPVATPVTATPAPATAERQYGIVVAGAGLATYVNADFRVQAGMAPVELVVEAVEPKGAGKVLSGGLLGDVNNDGRVDMVDALLVRMYSVDSSITVPNNGDIALGDVNDDGQVDLADALLIVKYSINPSDPALPAGLGQAVGGRAGKVVAGTIRRLTNQRGEDRNPSWSPDGRHIAFTSTRDDDAEIYVMGSDGTNLRRLTHHTGIDWSPDWSPDGRHIAFTSYRYDGDFDRYDLNIYVMGSDGSNLRRLTISMAQQRNLSWSPDGRHIAFEDLLLLNNNTNSDIYVMDSDGSNFLRLTHHTTNDWSPSWSPDGRHIAFTSTRDGGMNIYVMGSDGSNLRRLTTNRTGGMNPSWSPDGRHIAFTSTRAVLSDSRYSSGDIYVMDSDGSNPRRLTHHTAEDSSPDWSPDGRHIAFESNRDGDWEIYVMEVQMEDRSDDGPIRRLTHHTAEDSSPDWSPDGRHIAFVSERDGNEEIYVMGSDGTNPRRLTNHMGRSVSPAWSPDGRYIAFHSWRDNNGAIYVMGSDGSNLRRLIDHTADANYPVWSPDGRYIAFSGAHFSGAQRYGSNIYVMDSDGTNLRNLTPQARFTNWEHAWSPDGRHIAFTSYPDDNAEIYVMDSDGTNPRNLTNHTAWDTSPVWSPDGRHIAFVSERDGNEEIYVMGSDGSNLRRLADLTGRAGSPVWSPDGRYIAFFSGAEIYVMDSDGTNLRNLTNHTAWDWGHAWSPDGRHIAFSSNRDGNGEIYVMEVQGAGGPDRAVLVALYEATNGNNWTNKTNWLSDQPLGEWHGVTTDANGRVTHLELAENGLSGSLPPSLGNLAYLEVLTLFRNGLSGSLPPSLGNLTRLERLWIGRNQFSGALPSWLGNLTNLQRLELGYNQFSGSLPPSLGNLTNLRVLWLGGNDLSGELPSSLGNLTNLQELDLRDMQLCAPTDASFQTWLQGIGTKVGVRNCEDGGGSGTAKMYWTDHVTGSIQRANLDGSGVEDLVTELSSPTDLDLDLGNGGFYWTDYGTGKIQRANLDGSGVKDLVTSGLRVPSGIALDMGNGKMYWTDVGTDKIQRANLDGSGVEDLVTGLDHPHRIALDIGNGKMYWTDGVTDKIQRANLDGSGVEDLVASGLNDPVGIALDLDNSKMYWTDLRAFKIQRANLDGSGVEDLVTGLGGYPDGIALDLGNGKMYWTNAVTGSIQRANLDGNGVEDLVTGLGNPHGIVLDTSGQSSLPRDDYEGGAITFTVGEAVHLTLPGVPGGTPPYTYSVSGLPAGLSFDPETRTISGTPTVAGTYEMIYTVTDSAGASASLPLIVIVEPSDG